MQIYKLSILALGILLLLSEIDGAKVKGKKKSGKKKVTNNSSESSESSTESGNKSDSKEGRFGGGKNDTVTGSPKSPRSALSQLSKPGHGSNMPGHDGGPPPKFVPPHYGAPHSPHLKGGPSAPPPIKNVPIGSLPNGNIGFDIGGNGWVSVLEKAGLVVGTGLILFIFLACLHAMMGGGKVTHKMGKKSEEDQTNADKSEHVQLMVKVNEALERKF